MHERLRLKLKECLDGGFLPSWLTRGRTSLLQKDKSKGNVANNYRPITCLPLMWKLLTGVIADQIYAHLDQEKLLPEEQKVRRKGSRGTNNLLYIDKAVIKEVKSRKENLANLVPSAPFHYKRKAKKGPGTLQTRDQNLPK